MGVDGLDAQLLSLHHLLFARHLTQHQTLQLFGHGGNGLQSVRHGKGFHLGLICLVEAGEQSRGLAVGDALNNSLLKDTDTSMVTVMAKLANHSDECSAASKTQPNLFNAKVDRHNGSVAHPSESELRQSAQTQLPKALSSGIPVPKDYLDRNVMQGLAQHSHRFDHLWVQYLDQRQQWRTNVNI